ncbi:hypothetical protein OR16_22423 [Cupriavidus basilensis OR16]|uniref:Uncharacterized protein n=1 Tax=Cupriavidus basilensis OR16 TaxID=1127483 RepID=H1S909_9BURK|nr:hypothetical protein [Cupriavidus basilensis]EHP41025.1 hypothetical protein OR16_22423 [Cupriavidus basilensis OR16]
MSDERAVGSLVMLNFFAKLVGGDEDEQIHFRASGTYPKCRLQGRYRDQTIDVTATDFFQALCQIREVLAGDGLYPQCHGSSLNVYSVGRPHKVDDGLRAYRLSMGRDVTPFDMVAVFDACEASVLPATVREQHDYYWQWLQSTA